jgi:hypothetical protein
MVEFHTQQFDQNQRPHYAQRGFFRHAQLLKQTPGGLVNTEAALTLVVGCGV